MLSVPTASVTTSSRRRCRGRCYSMRKEWNRAKAEVAPWWAECSKEAFNTGLDALARALDALVEVQEGQARPAGRLASRGSSPDAAPRHRFGSRPARCASSLTACTSCCRGWAG